MRSNWMMPAALVAALLCTPAVAQQTKFAPTTTLAGKTLVLNGAGTRYRTVVKVYDLALYVPQKATSREAILAQKGPFRVRLVALRDIDAGDIGRAMVVGMRDNTDPEQAYRLARYTSKIIEIFSADSRIATGTQFGLDWVPGKGADFYLDGKLIGQISDAEFIEPFLSIWIGQAPADHRLKDRLLGLNNQPALAN
ncbi:chalcone isomerase family protein [Comamonas serinivorans]|nr:chalcone isomerase family protein [Comamonas serinivorans]